MPPAPLLGPRLKELLAERDWRYRDLSERSGIAIPMISKHVNDKNGVSPENQQRYAAALGIPVTELLGDQLDGDLRLTEIHRLLLESRDETAERLVVIAENLQGIRAQLAQLASTLGVRDARGRGRTGR